jgi:hypothetical protein
MQHMRYSAIILAALLTATPTLAAEQCLEVKPDPNIDPAMQPTYAKYADTAHCFLRIDGKVIINRTCHIDISPQTREWTMNGVAEVSMKCESDRPFYARFQRHGRWLNYGRVEADGRNRQEHICWGNKRFRMCVSQPYRDSNGTTTFRDAGGRTTGTATAPRR